MSYVRNLLQEIAKQLKRPMSDLQPYAKILEANWYSEQNDLKNIQQKQLFRLGIPGRLASMIKQKVNKKSETSKPQINNKVNAKMIIEQNSQQTVAGLLGTFKKKVSYQQFLQFTAIVNKIFTNIQFNLSQQKYRKINKGNTFALLSKYPQLIEILKLGGFTEQSNCIIMRKIDISSLNKFCEQLQLNSRPKFNPYQSSIGSLTGLIQNTGQDSTMIYVKKLQQLKQERQRLMSIPIKNRQVKISKFVSQFSIKRQIEKQNQNLNEDQYLFMQNIKQNLKKLEEGSNFTSKRKTEYQALLKVPCFSETLIRVKLPNNIIFQAKFSPLQKLGKLIQIFHSYLENKNTNYYLYMTPPVQKLDLRMQNMTFYDLGCVPKALFYFGSDQEIKGNILKQEKGIFFKIFS